MATSSATIKASEPKLRPGGGGRGTICKFPGGDGGGDGRFDPSPDFGEQLRRYRLGMAIGLAAVFMLFISFTSAYMVREGVGSWGMQARVYPNDWKPVSLPLGLLLVNTFLLIASSVAIEKARRHAFLQAAVAPAAAIPGVSVRETRRVPWLQLALALGGAFILGQLLAWRELMHRGSFISGNPSSSFVYLLTGLHAVHLAGGILALAYAAALAGFRSQPLERKRIVTDVTAWYWHFLTFMWLCIFALIAFVT